MTTQRKVEVFSAGCPACQTTIDLVNRLACSSCEVSVLDMNDIDGAKRARDLGTLRYYEKEELIQPASKSAAGYRLYKDEAVRRIRFIKHAQQCGFTLSDIHELLTLKHADSACCEDVRSLAIEKKLRIAHKLHALQAMSLALDESIHSCDGGDKATDDCPILAALEDSLHEDAR
jgi:MerR family Zn(II)-responsive transcriptional regulator of zntA